MIHPAETLLVYDEFVRFMNYSGNSGGDGADVPSPPLFQFPYLRLLETPA